AGEGPALAGVAERPGEEAPAEDQACADARRHREVGEVLVAAPGAPARLGERRRVGVVLDAYGRAERLGEEIAHRHHAPAREVRRVAAPPPPRDARAQRRGAGP